MADKNSYLLAKKIIEEFESEFTKQSADKKLIKDHPFSKRLRNIIDLVNNNEISRVSVGDTFRRSKSCLRRLKHPKGDSRFWEQNPGRTQKNNEPRKLSGASPYLGKILNLKTNKWQLVSTSSSVEDPGPDFGLCPGTKTRNNF